MNNYRLSVVLAAGAIKTIKELMIANIVARTYGTTAQRDAELNRIGGITSGVEIRPIEADIRISDGYKGVSAQGAADSTVMTPSDFTGGAAGGAGYLFAGEANYVGDGQSDIGHNVLYNPGAAAVTININYMQR